MLIFEQMQTIYLFFHISDSDISLNMQLFLENM